MDGSSHHEHEGAGEPVNTFALNTGEYISELITWADSKGICALQFVTNAERMSQCYGGGGGIPNIITETGGILAALAGNFKENIICQLQGVWRHDIQHTRVGGEKKYSNYYGGTGGLPFYDRPPFGVPDSGHISSIRVRWGAFIDGIQLTFVTKDGDHTIRSEGLYHGGFGGGDGVFDLDRGEHIVKITGREKHDGQIQVDRLCFTTNLGRISKVYGVGEARGKEFVCQAPLASNGSVMRLHSIYGRSGNWLHGILFVWAPA